MKRLYLSGFLFTAILFLAWGNSARAQVSTFNYTGAVQTYTVTPGVTLLGIDAIGGCGGGGYISSGSSTPVAFGGRVRCNLTVSSGQVLYIYVGKGVTTFNWSSAAPGGFNGGGTGGTFANGGGGATDIRLSAGTISGTQVTPYTATNRIIVAGGAGGGGDFSASGGLGGGLTGGTGGINTLGLSGTAGSGGTQTGPGPSGFVGSLGVGGNGSSYSGGGGGGGLYGGNGANMYNGGGGGSSYTDPVLCSAVTHTQGYSGANGNGQVIITVLCNAPGTISGNAPICPGANITLTETSSGGSWSSSNPAVATVNATTGVVTGVAPGTATITYTVSNPCGPLATATVTVNGTPSPLAPVAVCPGTSSTLTDTAAGGTWTSSSLAIATVGSTGVVTGVNAGSATITYTLPNTCSTTTGVTVNPLPAVFSITGGGPYCAGDPGAHIGLSGSTSGFSYQLMYGGSAVGSPVTGTGAALDFGLFTTAGAYTVVATNPATGCSKTMTGTATISVNPLPPAITGPANVCVGSTITLSNPMPGGTWTSSDPAKATVVIGTGVVTGVFAGTLSITYTLTSSGCSISTPVTVNGNPVVYSGPSAICVGATAILTDAGSGTWSSSNPLVANIVPSTGAVTGLSDGVAVITYTLPTGCYSTGPFTVNNLPDTTNTVTGGGSYCAGSAGVHVGISYSNLGISYQLMLGITPVGAPMPGSNSSLDFGFQTTAGTYAVLGTNLITGCSSRMSGSVNVSVLAAPAPYNLTGGGSYCAGGTGVSVGLDNSATGITYQLYNGLSPVGTPVAGTGSPFNFGTFLTTGSYTAIATDATTGCTQLMTGVKTISVNPVPAAYTVGGGGSYCAGGTGVDISLGGSDAGISYTLYLGSTADTMIVGSGGAIDFGHYTASGSYTVIASNTSCSTTMAGSAVVVINPVPTPYNVTGGGGYCAGTSGTHVGLAFSNTGVNYQLWNGLVPVGSAVAGSGSSLDFGIISTAGTYTVTAVNPATTCGSNMTGSAVVSVNLPPISYNLSGGGGYCPGTSGVSIGTSLSESGVSYQLFRGTTPIGAAVTGTGSVLTFGTFTAPGTYVAIATNLSTHCSANLTGTAVVNTNPSPLVYTVTGGGHYCAGDTGAHVMLSGSEAGTNYELFYNGSTTGIIMTGAGTAIDFGLQTSGGTYTVVATNATSCIKNMAGSAGIIVNPAPNAYNVIGGGGVCPGGTGLHIGLDGSNTGMSYQLYNGSATVGLPQSGSGAPVDFGLETAAGTYTVTAKNLITGCTSPMNGSGTITLNPLPNDYAISSGGNYCSHGIGVEVSLPSGSDAGASYQLYFGATSVGAPVAGSGGVITFGYHTTPGAYTVVATNSSGCAKRMPGTAIIGIISPAVFTVTGGGNFCSGDTGVIVGQAGSAISETYQLFQNWDSIGAPVAGTGAALNFGPQTLAGTYNVTATNITYGCKDTMAGAVHVIVNALPAVNNVTGGGAYCAGGTAPHILLSGSGAGINYQLYKSGTATGPAVSGTGSSLDFGSASGTGTYTVMATNATTGCKNTMADSAVVTVNPVPAKYVVSIDNSGYYCAADSGLHIRLANSDPGIRYQLLRGTTPVGSFISGTGSTLDMGLQIVAGTYIITGTDTATSCADNMLGDATLTIIPLPAVHNVTGGGNYCPGGDGVHIGLDGSDPGIYYQLFDGPYSAGSLLGTGAPLDFGLQIARGSYVVVANSVITDCPNTMFGSAHVAYDTLLTPVVTLNAFPGTGIGVWHVDSIRAFVTDAGTNPTYQWLINGNAVPGATNESFTNHAFYNNDSVTCLVTASGICGGNTTSQSLVLTLVGVGVHGVASLSDDIKLIPNPNKGRFAVKGSLGNNQDEEVTLEVVNMVGQILYSNKTTTQNGSIDQQIQLPGSIASGMYMLNVKTADRNIVFHFVIE